MAICGALALAGCGDGGSTAESTGVAETVTEQTESSTDVTSISTADPSKKPTVQVPAGAPPIKLVENEAVEGYGPTAEAGDEVTINYVGVGYESGKEFDTTWDRKPFTFRLGSGVLIPGGERGVKGMKVGGRRALIIPPDLAYGKAGFPPTIAANETLIFVVDLLAVK